MSASIERGPEREERDEHGNVIRIQPLRFHFSDYPSTPWVEDRSVMPRFNTDVTVSGSLIGKSIEITTNIAGALHSRVIDTEEKLIREGLIRLGWTPPMEEV